MLNLRRTALLAALLITSLAMGPLQAQTVWRCGEGGKRYSDSPCPGGKAVDVADPRSTAEVRSAQDSVQRTQALADRMRLQRLQEEQRNLAANAHAANVGPSKADTPKAGHKTPRAKAEQDGAVKPRKLAKQEDSKPQRRQPQQPTGAVAGAGTFQAVAAGTRQMRD